MHACLDLENSVPYLFIFFSIAEPSSGPCSSPLSIHVKKCNASSPIPSHSALRSIVDVLELDYLDFNDVDDLQSDGLYFDDLKFDDF